jgi:transcription initiation factor TFIIIB Brf1 subunit/transcription initiation factor TFIIB
MATTSKTTELLMRCPECGAECGMKIDTSDLTSVECADCGETIDPRDAAEKLRDASSRWEAFAEWLAAATTV